MKTRSLPQRHSIMTVEGLNNQEEVLRYRSFRTLKLKSAYLRSLDERSHVLRCNPILLNSFISASEEDRESKRKSGAAGYKIHILMHSCCTNMHSRMAIQERSVETKGCCFIKDFFIKVSLQLPKLLDRCGLSSCTIFFTSYYNRRDFRKEVTEQKMYVLFFYNFV